MAGWLLLGIRRRFHNHATEQLAIRLAFHQQGADERGGGPARWGGITRIGGGAGRAWWLWEWLCVSVEAIGRRPTKTNNQYKHSRTQAGPNPALNNFHTKRVTSGETSAATQRP